MLRNLFCQLVAAVWPAILFPFTILHGLLTWNSDNALWIPRHLWSPGLLWAGGGKLQVEGLENVDFRKPHVFVCNHQSTIDIPSLFMALPISFRWVAKSQLKWVPFIGWYLAATGHIFVNRSNRQKAIASLDKAAKKIRGGTNIIIFPEGTRSPDLRVQPFKKGPFALALHAGVPVVPVTIEGSGRLMPKNTWRITPGPIRVKVGKPIEVAPFAPDDRAGLARRVREVIIAQSLALGGLGGDLENAIAAAGKEGVAERTTRPEKAA
jgi:1-acyl-sn-glycerol-3-phosphate acyltransferase